MYCNIAVFSVSIVNNPGLGICYLSSRTLLCISDSMLYAVAKCACVSVCPSGLIQYCQNSLACRLIPTTTFQLTLLQSRQTSTTFVSYFSTLAV